MIVEYNP